MNFDYCKNKCPAPSKKKLETGGNNPKTSKRMQYSQYVNNVTPSIVYTTNSNNILEAKGLLFKPEIKQVAPITNAFTNGETGTTGQVLTNEKVFI